MDRSLIPAPVVERELAAPCLPNPPAPSARDRRDDGAHADREARAAVPPAADAGSIEYASWFPVHRD